MHTSARRSDQIMGLAPCGLAKNGPISLLLAAPVLVEEPWALGLALLRSTARKDGATLLPALRLRRCGGGGARGRHVRRRLGRHGAVTAGACASTRRRLRRRRRARTAPRRRRQRRRPWNMPWNNIDGGIRVSAWVSVPSSIHRVPKTAATGARQHPPLRDCHRMGRLPVYQSTSTSSLGGDAASGVTGMSVREGVP